jgi:hypothetical protein
MPADMTAIFDAAAARLDDRSLHSAIGTFSVTELRLCAMRLGLDHPENKADAVNAIVGALRHRQRRAQKQADRAAADVARFDIGHLENGRRAKKAKAKKAKVRPAPAMASSADNPVSVVLGSITRDGNPLTAEAYVRVEVVTPDGTVHELATRSQTASSAARLAEFVALSSGGGWVLSQAGLDNRLARFNFPDTAAHAGNPQPELADLVGQLLASRGHPGALVAAGDNGRTATFDGRFDQAAGYVAPGTAPISAERRRDLLARSELGRKILDQERRAAR